MAARTPAPHPVVAAASADDHLATLRAMRDVLARKLADPATPARELAALAGRMQSLLTDIAALAPTTTTGTSLDELDKRRRSRGAAPARRERPAR